jgi:hypothetical protein
MGPATIRERYPRPWSVQEMDGGYRVMSSNGFPIAWIYSKDAFARNAVPNTLSHSEALAIARAIALLPERD